MHIFLGTVNIPQCLWVPASKCFNPDFKQKKNEEMEIFKLMAAYGHKKESTHLKRKPRTEKIENSYI